MKRDRRRGGRKDKENYSGWILLMDVAVWLVVILFVLIGSLFAIQTDNLFLKVVLLSFIFITGTALASSLMVFSGTAKDIKAIRHMLAKMQNPNAQTTRHRRSSGRNRTDKKGLL